MSAPPRLSPVICGCVAGALAPAGITTLPGIVTFDGSLLMSAMVTVEGAGVGNVTGKSTDSPSPKVTFGRRLMDCWGTMTTVELVSARCEAALALITADPAATPVTGTSTV